MLFDIIADRQTRILKICQCLLNVLYHLRNHGVNIVGIELRKLAIERWIEVAVSLTIRDIEETGFLLEGYDG